MPADVFQSIRINAHDLIDLLNALSDVDMRDEDGQTPLHEAVAANNGLAVRKLIARGANVDAQDRDGQTPLHYAAAHRNPAFADALLAAGADPAVVDLHGNSALWTAVFNARGNYETVKAFLKRGCRDFAVKTNAHGRSPLDFARQIRDGKLVAMLSSDEPA